MSTSAIHDTSPQTPATASAAWEIHLRIPELPGFEQAQAESPRQPGPAAKPTVGMRVLNRIIDRRDARRNWRRGWGQRLWLTATCLTALSALALVAGFLRVDSEIATAEGEIVDEAGIVGNLADDAGGQAAPDAPAAQQAALQVAEPAAPAAPAAASDVSTANYEASSGPAVRGAWLTGTIEFDETPTR